MTGEPFSPHSQTFGRDLVVPPPRLEDLRKAIESFEDRYRPDPAALRRANLLRSIEARCWRKTKPISRGAR